MIVALEAVLMPPKDGYREIARYAYTKEETIESERTDSVQDANHALQIVKKLCGEAIREGEPPRGKEYQDLWVIQLQVTRTHKKSSNYRVAYHKHNGCQLVAIEDMMEIYAAINECCEMPSKDVGSARK